MLGCAAGSNLRQRFIRKCNPPVVGSGAYRCPPDNDANAEEKEADCAASTPVCYDSYRGKCGCSKDISNVPSSHAEGDGTAQGSCSSNQVCNGDGECKDRGIHILKNYILLLPCNSKYSYVCLLYDQISLFSGLCVGGMGILVRMQ